ncbi:TIGR03086 family metal-binding protein [Streptosporangium sp. 'caverna']|uniref:TIGR03086 family metal-binding protein n=1 Tax=Streptosporangium sp. 'caverna' TaxID=2202249 RepID=UPI000D7E650E|nr:TIGR03086 family metal-binding protein [Streptosporangium sp. 'caverna']AWS47693.1 TIGR03086 family protein [Streptosporangium sp. 'caverna']
MASPSEDLARAYEAVGDLIAEIRPEQWKAPTPCTEWNVREVVDHLVGMDLVFVALIESGPMPDRGADRLGDDPVGAWRASSASLRAAFSRPGVLERSYAGPMGSATGAERLQIRLYDLLAHGWDLAQATGIPVRVPEDLAERSLAFALVQLSPQPRTGRFAEPQLVEESAPAIDRLAAFLGRSVLPQR